MKRSLCILLALCLLLSLAACGGAPKTASADEPAAASPAEPTEAPAKPKLAKAPAEPEPTEAPDEPAPTEEAAAEEDDGRLPLKPAKKLTNPAPTESPAEPEEEREPEGPTEGAPLSEFQPVGGDIDGVYRIEIIGASFFQDADGDDALRVYYLYTNLGDDVATPWWVLSVAAEQGGEPLTYTYAASDGDASESTFSGYTVQPGVTVPCKEEFKVDMDGGPVTVTIADDETDAVTAEFDPWSLTTRSPVGDFWELELLDDPQFFLDYPLAAETEGFDAEIVNAELVDPGPGEVHDVLRVYLQFTNKTDEAVPAYWLADIVAYQDGIELSAVTPAEEIPSDGQLHEDVAPGETVTISVCWGLRTGSPVEAVVTDIYGSDGVVAAATMPLA